MISTAHHLVAHRGVRATAHLLSTKAFLISGRAAIERQLATCIPCQVKRGEPKPQRHTFATTTSGFPFQRISMDFVGPLPRTMKGNTMILTIKDTFSKWVEAFPLARATAENVAKILEKEIFARYGYPDYIHSDRGSQFTGSLMTELAQLVHISITVTPAYHPQSNPVERAHRDLKSGLRAALEMVGGKQWDECIPQVLFAFRISPARGTGYSPFVMLFGRDPNLPLGAVDQPPGKRRPTNEYVDQLWNRMERIHGWARRNLAKEVARQQRLYTEPTVRYREGDQVWLYSPSLSTEVGRKLVRPWTGPWTVSKEISPVLYEIRNRQGQVTPAAIDRLQPYTSPITEDGSQEDSYPKQTPTGFDGSWISLPRTQKKGGRDTDSETDGETDWEINQEASNNSPRYAATWMDEDDGPDNGPYSHHQNQRGQTERPKVPTSTSLESDENTDKDEEMGEDHHGRQGIRTKRREAKAQGSETTNPAEPGGKAQADGIQSKVDKAPRKPQTTTTGGHFLRPRRQSRSATKHRHSEDSQRLPTAASECQATGPNQPAKRPRGRPRKNQ